MDDNSLCSHEWIKIIVIMRNMNPYPIILVRKFKKSNIQNRQRHYYTLGHRTVKYQRDNQKITIFKLPAGVYAAATNGYIHLRIESWKLL
jgi:hypothetical protein